MGVGNVKVVKEIAFKKEVGTPMSVYCMNRMSNLSLMTVTTGAIIRVWTLRTYNRTGRNR